MDIEEPLEARPAEFSDEEEQLIVSHEEVETMVCVEDEEAAGELLEKPVRVWPEISTVRANRFRSEIEEIKEVFADELDDDDTTMVSEYANEIFEYMNELEVSSSHIRGLFGG